MQKYTKFAKFTGLYFPHFTEFFKQVDNCMKLSMLFPAVLIDFPNSQVCLIGEWPNISVQENYGNTELFLSNIIEGI